MIKELDNRVDEIIKRKQKEKALLDAKTELAAKTEKIGFVENIKKGGIGGFFDKATLGFKELGGNLSLMDAANRLKNNQYYDSDEGYKRYSADVDMLNAYQAQQEEYAQRGMTIPAQVGQVLGDMLPFAAEFMLTQGTTATAKQAVKSGVKRALGSYADNAIGKAIAGTAGTMASAATRTAMLPQETANRFAEQSIPQIQVDQQGNPTFTEPTEGTGTRLLKAFGDTYIEMLSEESGDAFKVVGGGIGKMLASKSKTIAKLGEAWTKATGGKMGEFYNKISSMTGYHGMLEEMGEERIGDVLRALTNIDDFGAGKDADVFQRLAASVPSGEQLAVESLAFGIPAVARNVAGRMTQERPPQEPTGTPPKQDYYNMDYVNDLIGKYPQAKDMPENPSRKDFENIGIFNTGADERRRLSEHFRNVARINPNTSQMGGEQGSEGQQPTPILMNEVKAENIADQPSADTVPTTANPQLPENTVATPIQAAQSEGVVENTPPATKWYHGGAKGLDNDLVEGWVTKDLTEAQSYADKVGGVVYEVDNDAVNPAKPTDKDADGRPIGDKAGMVGYIKPVPKGQKGWKARPIESNNATPKVAPTIETNDDIEFAREVLSSKSIGAPVSSRQVKKALGILKKQGIVQDKNIEVDRALILIKERVKPRPTAIIEDGDQQTIKRIIEDDGYDDYSYGKLAAISRKIKAIERKYPETSSKFEQVKKTIKEATQRAYRIKADIQKVNQEISQNESYKKTDEFFDNLEVDLDVKRPIVLGKNEYNEVMYRFGDNPAVKRWFKLKEQGASAFNFESWVRDRVSTDMDLGNEDEGGIYGEKARIFDGLNEFDVFLEALDRTIQKKRSGNNSKSIYVNDLILDEAIKLNSMDKGLEWLKIKKSSIREGKTKEEIAFLEKEFYNEYERYYDADRTEERRAEERVAPEDAQEGIGTQTAEEQEEDRKEGQEWDGVSNPFDFAGKKAEVIAREDLVPKVDISELDWSQYEGGVEGFKESETKGGDGASAPTTGKKITLDENQKIGILLALKAISRKQSFMLADGTGFGKTMQLLIIANENQKRTGKKSLIITENQQIISTRFAADAKSLGIDISNIEIGTYTGLSDGKIGNGEYSVVLFDEAHNLKNTFAKKTMASNKIKTDSKVFATATPMDRPTGASYFLSQITGIPEEEVQKRLGYTLVEQFTADGKSIIYPQLNEGFEWRDVWSNILDMRDKAIQSGNYIRREFKFNGEVKKTRAVMPATFYDDEHAIDAYWQAKMDYAKSRRAKMNYGGQRMGELSRFTEQAKVRAIFSKVIEDLKAGRRVIVVAEGVNPTEIKALGRVVPGFISEFARMLDNAGYGHAEIYGSSKEGKSSAVEKFQSGEYRIAIMTPQSGGTGIDLDDTVGDDPVKMYIVTANFSGDKFDQILGRVSRRNSKSPAEVLIVSSDSMSDNRRDAILNQKVKTLRAIQKGQDPDEAAGFEIPFNEGGETVIYSKDIKKEDFEGWDDIEGFSESSAEGTGSAASFGSMWTPDKKPSTGETKAKGHNQPDRQIFNLIDIVDLAKNILDGKFPKVLKRLRAGVGGGNVHGLFRHKGEEGEIQLWSGIFIGEPIRDGEARDADVANVKVRLIRDVLLRSDLQEEDITVKTYPSRKGWQRIVVFRNDPDYASKVLGHEVGHLVDWMPQRDIRKGNLLGRLASILNFRKHQLAGEKGGKAPLTQKERDRLKRLARKLMSGTLNIEVDEEIRNVYGVTPEDILRIWNSTMDMRKITPELYEYIARLSSAEKKSIVKEAIKGKIPEELLKFARVEYVKTGKKIKKTIQQEPTSEEISEKYRQLIMEEVEKRQLLELEIIRGELEKLTKWWNPYTGNEKPRYLTYRTSGRELYAEAFSVLLNNPAELARRAPMFYRGFFGWLVNKPEVMDNYYRITDSIKNGTNLQEAENRMKDEMRKSDIRSAKKWLKIPLNMSDFQKALRVAFVDKFAITKALSRRLIRQGVITKESDPKHAIDDAVYSSSEKELYLNDTKNRVIKPLDDNNISIDDFGLYLFYKRVITDREKLANPRGFTKKTAQEQLDAMAFRYGDRFKIMEQAKKALWEIRKELVISKARETGIYNDALMTKLEDNEDYAFFNVAKFIKEEYDGIGKDSTAQIYQQVGTLEDVQNPYDATIDKDLSLIVAMNWNKAKKATVEFLLKFAPEAITETEKTWSGKKYRYNPVKNADIKTIFYLDKGELKAYNVDTWYSDAFFNEDSKVVKVGSVVARAVGMPFRAVFTGTNAGFWAYNKIRDFRRTIRNLPDANLRNFLGQYLTSYKEAWNSTQGNAGDITRELLKNKALISVADYGGITNEDRTHRRLINMYSGVKSYRAKLINPVWHFHQFLRVGEAIERLPKIAAWKYLNQQFPDMSKGEKVDIIRTQAGSPSFLTKGSYTWLTNNLFLFSNAAIQGWRSDIKVYQDRPVDAVRKLFSYTLLPKMVMWSLASGSLLTIVQAMGGGDDDELVKYLKWNKSLFDGISEYDKANFLCIPLYKNDKNKTVYLRTPFDENERFFGGLFWKTMNLNIDGVKGAQDLLDYTQGQTPGLNPVFNIVLNGIIPYLSGINPYDKYRGRNIVPENAFKAGGMASHKYMLAHIWNSIGGGVIKRAYVSDMPGEQKDMVESISDLPVLGNIFGRFLRSSDRGLSEQIKEATGKAQKIRAQELEQIKSIAKKQLEGQTISEPEKKLLEDNEQYAKGRLEKGMARQSGDVYRNELLYAQTRAEKDAIHLKILEIEGKDFNLTPYIEPDILTKAKILGRKYPTDIKERKEHLIEARDTVKWFKDRNVKPSDIRKIYYREIKSMKNSDLKQEHLRKLNLWLKNID